MRAVKVIAGIRCCIQSLAVQPQVSQLVCKGPEPVFGISSDALALPSQTSSGQAGGASDSYGLRRSCGPRPESVRDG